MGGADPATARREAHAYTGAVKLFTAQQMRDADARAVEAGMPTLLLMEAAGRAVADALAEAFPAARAALVLCGKGNNGGDGYVAARFLRGRGLPVVVLELAPEPHGDDARSARAALRAHGVMPAPLEPQRLASELQRCDVVVDALLGSGLDRPLEGALAEHVRRVNDSGVRVVAVDVPTGVASDAPVPPGPYLQAALTVQLAGPKLAAAFEPARGAFGGWRVADIGIPADVLDASSDVTLLDAATVAPHRPRRSASAHKYSVGTTLVVAGSARYLGAAELASRAAYRAGAGLVTLAAERRAPAGWPEVVLQPLDWGAAAPLGALDELDTKRAGALVVGPGLDERAVPYLPELLARFDVPVVLDAGALTTSPELREAARRHGRCVLTPHAGEAARLLGTSSGDVSARPLASAREIARRYGAVCVLKGATTTIAERDGRVAVSAHGHPGMAVGGTGDVLAGVLGAVLPGGEGFERACFGVVVHGLAGERAGARYGDGLVADDVVAELPSAFASVTASAVC